MGDNDSLWRYQRVLPAVNEMVTLGEGKTPLLQVDNNVWIKDETINPTGSFKDRGMGLAVTMAKAQSVESICLPSAGNAGVSAAAYCQKAGIDCHVFLPETIPTPFKKATEKYKQQKQFEKELKKTFPKPQKTPNQKQNHCFQQNKE